jgi:AcrR family transcriptional regulator
MPRGGTTERGRQTRARIVDAAAELFYRQGYLATTMAAIAAEADVSVQTLYLSFGSKVAILTAAHDRAVVGDDEPVPVLGRPWVDDVRNEVDGRQALRIAMDNSLTIIEHTSRVRGAIQSAAADPEVAELLHTVNDQRLATLQEVASLLATKPGFAPELPVERAADILYATISDELYRILVIQRNWIVEDWKTWAYEGAAFRMFPDAHPDYAGRHSRGRPPAASEARV